MPSKFQIDCVDALALSYALERLTEHNYGNGVESVVLDEDEEILEFTTSRYAMDGGGFHVGYEKFTAVLELFEIRSPYMGATPYSGCYVVPDFMDVSWEPAQEPFQYKIEDAIGFLDEYVDNWREELDDDPAGDDVLQLAFDEGMGEFDYCPPDEDFAYQELQYHLEKALEDMPDGEYQMDEEGRRWNLTFSDGEIVRTFWIERAIGESGYERPT